MNIDEQMKFFDYRYKCDFNNMTFCILQSADDYSRVKCSCETCPTFEEPTILEFKKQRMADIKRVVVMTRLLSCLKQLAR